MEGVFKNVITSLESTISESEARRVKLLKEFDRKNQILEEHLQKLSEQ